MTLRELHQIVSTATLHILLLASVAAVFAWVSTVSGFVQPVEAFLSFVPGRQAEIAVDADLGVVAMHRLVLITLIITGAPLAANRIRVSRPRG